MATRYWQGNGAPVVAQQTSVTVTAFDVTTTYTITIGGVSISVLGAGSNPLTAAAIQAALAALTAAQFLEITWTVNSATITGTAKTPGYPFMFTKGVSGGAGTLGSVTTVVANGSGNDWSNALNWSGQTLPAGTDTIIIANTAVSILYGLDYLASTAIANCTALGSFTGTIGLPSTNKNGYPEYRIQELEFGTCTILNETLPTSVNTPAQRKYNVGSNACTATFAGQGNGKIGSEITWWRGTHASNVVNGIGCSLGIAAIPSYTSTLPTLVAIQGSVVRCGSGVSAGTTWTITGTTMDVQSNVTNFYVNGGSNVICRNTMTIGDFLINGGSVIYNSTGTITNLQIGSQDTTGSIDFSSNVVGAGITSAITAYKGSTYNDPLGVITAGNGINVPAGSLTDINFNAGIKNGLGLTFTWS